MKKAIFQFSKYSIVGITATIINVFFMWLLIDYLMLNTKIATAAVVIGVFYYKFLVFLKLNIIHNRLDKYLIINVMSGAINWTAATILIEKAGWSAGITAATVVITLFILRFFALKWIGLMK